MVEEEELSGGNSTRVVQVGDTVRRTPGPWSPAVHRLLATLHAGGVTQVPQPLGFDDRGREILTHLPGEVGNYPLPDWLWRPSVLDESAALLRRVHDASRPLVHETLTWSLPSHEPAQVICHNDVAPYNLVFRDGAVAGLIDFDTASPGPRVWDLAYLAYRLAPLVGDADVPTLSTRDRLARIDRLVAAYGMPITRREVLTTMITRLDELAAYTDGRAAETGDPQFVTHAALYRADRRTVGDLLGAP